MKLVSIISPCYNGEKYVSRFLDSVLSQTYNNIELIVINDGSIDKTLDVLESYQCKFRERGYRYIILTQENGGQSNAINQGLKVFSGDYLTWPDSDDRLTNDCIEKKVDYMETHPEKGIVICKTKVVDYETGDLLGFQQRNKVEGEDCLWKDLILGRNVYYSPGGFFVRTSMFRDSMPKPLKIQDPREIGQNYQLMIPISYKYPYGLIDDVLYIYSVRQGSHSHIKHTFEERNHIINIAKNVLCGIAADIEPNIEKREYIMNIIRKRNVLVRLEAMEQYHRKDFLIQITKELNDLKLMNMSMKIRIQCIRHSSIYFCVKTLRTIKRIIADRLWEDR